MDAYHPELAGGTGKQADHGLAAEIGGRVPRMMLAGGLTAENVASTIDDAFGECVIVTPTVFRPNHQPMPDASQAFQTIATFTWRSKIVFKQNSGAMLQQQEALIETRAPVFSFSRHNLPMSLQHLWQVTRLSDGNVFEISSVEPDGVSRILVQTKQLGRPTQ